MADREISAWFDSPDDAADAAVSLKAAGARDIVRDRNPGEQEGAVGILPFYAGTGGFTSGETRGNVLFPILASEVRSGMNEDTDARQAKETQHDVMLTFKIDESRLPDALDIIRRKRGKSQ